MTNWKNILNEDIQQEQFNQKVKDRKLSKEEKEDLEKTKQLFNEDVSKYLD